jgi:NAD-dependent DNA ligase
VASIGNSGSRGQPLAGQTLAFSGRLRSLGRREARTAAQRLGATVVDDVSAHVTVLVAVDDTGQKLRRAEQINAESPGHVRIITEDEFCDLAGVPSPSALRKQYHAQRDLLERYPNVREDRLRYMA